MKVPKGIGSRVISISNQSENGERIKQLEDLLIRMGKTLEISKVKLVETKKKEEDVQGLLKEVLKMKEQITNNEATGNLMAKSGSNVGTPKLIKNSIFCAKRSSSYSKTHTTVTYDSTVKSNEEDYFNQETGKFKAPVYGIYHFYFSALKMKKEISGTSRLGVQLRDLNPREGGQSRMLAEGYIDSNECCGIFPVKIEATVELGKDYLVWIELTEGAIYANVTRKQRSTIFGGFLVGGKI